MTSQQILNADCTTIDPVSLAGVHHVFCDPPYRGHVHDAAVSCAPKKGITARDFGFDCLSPTLRDYIAKVIGIASGWSLAYSDVEESHRIRIAVENDGGSEYIRTLPWVRWSMPQTSADRPTQGFEHVLLFHPAGTKRWFGPGETISLEHEGPPPVQHKCLRGEEKHKAEKPLDQALDFVAWFSRPGESVYDPVAGHGTIGLACALLDRDYLGCEVDGGFHATASARLHGPLSARDQVRIVRWVESTQATIATCAARGGVQDTRCAEALAADLAILVERAGGR